MTISPAPAAVAFRNSYPLDINLYNDDQQDVLYITDHPAGHKLYLDIVNASGQTIAFSTIGMPPATVASTTNYHFVVRFRPATLSPVFQSYLTYAIAILQGSKPAALSDVLVPYATETVTALQALQQQGWSIGYGQEAGGTDALYLLSTGAQTMAPGATISIIFPHAVAAGASGARSTRVELNYQLISLDNNGTQISGSRQSQLSIVNQRGQKNIPLHVSFVGANAILNDGKSLNMLTLRITNTQQDQAIALSPADTNAPSRFVLSFDVQADGETADWALGTISQVRALHMTGNDPGHWRVEPAPSSSQAQTPQWILLPQPGKTTLAPYEAVTVTIDNILSSLPPGQTNLYIGYQNFPGFWDGQIVVPLEKLPLLYRYISPGVSNVGIGTDTPQGALDIGPEVLNENAWVYFQGNANGVLNPSAAVKQGLMLAWNPSGGQGETQLLYTTGLGGDPRLDFGRWDGKTKVIDVTLQNGKVGIGTNAPHSILDVHGSDFQIGISNVQDHNWGLVNWTDDKLYFQYREQGQYKSNAMWLDKEGHVTLTGLTLGNTSLQQGVNWTTEQIHYHSYPDGATTIAPVTSSNGLKIMAGDGGVLAVNSGDVLCWASYGVVVKGQLWAENKYFRIEHPAKPDAYLVHACLEGPESSVYYRGRAQLIDGCATIRLPDYFEPLTRPEGRTVLLTPEGREPFLLSYESVADGTFMVYGTAPGGVFSWEVKAVRADVEQLQPEIRKANRQDNREV